MYDLLKSILQQIPRYFLELLDLTIHPKGFIAAKFQNNNEPYADAFSFLGITLAIAIFLSVITLPKSQNSEKNLILLGILTAIIIGGTMILTLLSLKASWAIVGGKASLQELFVCTAYMFAPCVYILDLFSITGYMLFKILDPESFKILTTSGIDAVPDEILTSFGAISWYTFTVLGFFFSLSWALFAWGAYRSVNRVTKIRSIVAYIINMVFSIPLLLFSALLSQVIT